MKLWQTTDSLDSLIESFTTGLDPELDLELIPYDCRASIAHATMLGKMGFLDGHEVESLIGELNAIIELHSAGRFTIRPDQEDGHTAIEMFLVEKLGDTGKKIHTGRSRNDQVLTALRLYEKDALTNMTGLIEELAVRMELYARDSGDLPLPGYTHTRKAMPFTVGEWMQAFADALRDDKHMISSTLVLIDRNPLGTGAGYGVPLPLDRDLTTRLLGFGGTIANPMHAHNSRGKLESRILGDCAMVLYDLNKWASDLILFTLPELGYFSLKPSFVTGSSIMPHKQNPDVLELIRAAYHKVNGYEMQLRNIPSNLISGYHRDLQLTKEPLIRGLKTSFEVIKVSIHLIDGIVPNPDKLNAAMTDELLSVKKVLDLVKSGIPFRDAYRQISGLYKRDT